MAPKNAASGRAKISRSAIINFMKFRILGLGLIFLALLVPVSAFALTDLQKGVISQNCASMKQSLKSLQKADSRTRIHLGSNYEIILNKFMTPLNLRLTRDNHPDPNLSAIQSDFAISRATFSKRFIKYSQNLEELISINCQSEPEHFAKQLDKTRKSRAKVADAVATLHRLVERHSATVRKLQESLQ